MHFWLLDEGDDDDEDDIDDSSMDSIHRQDGSDDSVNDGDDDDDDDNDDDILDSVGEWLLFFSTQSQAVDCRVPAPWRHHVSRPERFRLPSDLLRNACSGGDALLRVDSAM